MLINIDKLRMISIEEIIEETPTVKTLVFKDSLSHNAKPGQFLMIWIPRREELPMSAMINKKTDYAAVTVRKYGYGSSALFDKKIGDTLGVRGPYGNQFDITNVKRAILVGGGTGLVPLMRLAVALNSLRINTTFIIGARTEQEVFFDKLINEVLSTTPHKVIIATEDGSSGFRGYSTDILKQLLDVDKNFDCIYSCGPELMLKKIFALSTEYSIPFQASLERYMKCGIGICGSCCIGDRLVCKDGTIFDQYQLSRLDEFGNTYRDKSGRKDRF